VCGQYLKPCGTGLGEGDTADTHKEKDLSQTEKHNVSQTEQNRNEKKRRREGKIKNIKYCRMSEMQ
jgi:hypothetical protein